MMERLDVYLCNQPVGTLTRSDTGDLSFQYLPEYLNSNAIPLSSTLPLDPTPFKNLPALSDLAESTHPSPVYHDIIQGIFARIRQLERASADSAIPR